MALVHYSAVVSQIKGKLRGAIFQAGPAGQIVRSAKNFNRTASTRWQSQKNRVMVVSQSWNALTDAQRASWEAIAVNSPSVNSFGEPRIPSGYNIFCSANLTGLAAGQALLLSPTMFTALTDETGTEANLTETTNLEIQVPNLLGANELLLIDASAGIRPSRKVPPAGFKRLGFFDTTGGTIINVYSEYTAIFGKPVKYGKIVYNVYVYNTLTGQKSIKYLCSGIAVI